MCALFLTVFIIIFIKIIEIKGTILHINSFGFSSAFSYTCIIYSADVINFKRFAYVFERALSFRLTIVFFVYRKLYIVTNIEVPNHVLKILDFSALGPGFR